MHQFWLEGGDYPCLESVIFFAIYTTFEIIEIIFGEITNNDRLYLLAQITSAHLGIRILPSYFRC